jgi:hypothetical protein
MIKKNMQLSTNKIYIESKLTNLREEKYAIKKDI